MKAKTRAELLATYDYVGDFCEGLARARKNGVEFHIYSDGKPAYAERYDEVGDFHEGLAWVKKDGVEFHIRYDGKVNKPCEIDPNDNPFGLFPVPGWGDQCELRAAMRHPDFYKPLQPPTDQPT